MQTATEHREQLLIEIMQADESSGLYNQNKQMQDIESHSDDDLITELVDRGYKVFAETSVDRRRAVDFASETLTTDEILDRLDSGDIFDYAFKHVDPDDVIVSDFLPHSKSGSNIYKSDVIKLIQELAAKNGWDFVYALVEPHKII